MIDLNIDLNKDIKNNKIGFVYFITNGQNIKIGFTSKSPKQRLKQLNTGSDKQLFLLGYMSATQSKEKELHSQFEYLKIRSNGEWFQVDDKLLDYINEVNEIKNTYVFRNECCNNQIMSTLCIRK